jgi:predicted regulator of Ras-like GTPase activity (Roadblock/LC7/MglB family)
MPRSLTESDEQKLQRVLRELHDRCEADSCLLCDDAGHVLCQVGVENQDPLVISALGAGVFAASRELAMLLGEDKFSALVHQGEKKSIYISAVNVDVLLVVLFSSQVSLGVVKLYSAPAAAAVKAVVESPPAAGTATGDAVFRLSQKGELFARSDS